MFDDDPLPVAVEVKLIDCPLQILVALALADILLGNGFTVAVTAVRVEETQPVVVFLDCE